MYRDIVYTVYLFAVLVESHTAQLLCEAGNFFLHVPEALKHKNNMTLKKNIQNLLQNFSFSKNIPGVLKRQNKGGGGRKTMHFFL